MLNIQNQKLYRILKRIYRNEQELIPSIWRLKLLGALSLRQGIEQKAIFQIIFRPKFVEEKKFNIKYKKKFEVSN